jgi:outer membrane protein W
MIKRFVAGSFAFWLILYPCAGMAKEAQPRKLSYVGVTAGKVVVQEVETYDRANHISLPDVKQSYEWMLGVKVGHTPQIWGRMTPIVVELEAFMITKADAKTSPYFFHPIGSNVDFAADISVRDVMLNFFLRHPYGRVHPYGGFGLGWVWFELEDARLTFQPGFTWPETGTRVNNQGDLSDDAFGYQFMAGVNFDLTDTWSIDLGYRYFVTEPEFDYQRTSFPTIAAPTELDVKFTYETQILTLGVTYWF